MTRLFIGLFLLIPSLAWGQAFTIENPQPGGTYSGIGALTGWRCTGGTITFVFDTGLTVQAGYGTSRNDTIGACGDANNGFAALMNFNLLGDGQHTVSVRNNGTQFAFVTFNVKTLGAEFLTGRSGSAQIQNFPNAGQTTTVQWQQSSQNFVIANVTGGGGGSIPNVTGRWGYDVDFAVEDCSFISIPPDLPTSIVGSFTVSQSGGNLTITEGTSTHYTGEVEPDGSFAVIGDLDQRTAGGCTFGILAGIAGNFLDGNLLVIFAAARISGVCTAVSLPCSVAYFGSLGKLSSATATIAERNSGNGQLEQVAEQMKAAAE